MARRHYTIEPVDSDKQSRREWTRDIPGLDLSVSKIRRDAESARKQRRIDCSGCKRRHAKEPARIRERLDHATIGATKNRYITNKPESKLIVEQTIVPANHCARCCGPRKTYTRRDISLRDKLRVVVP